MTVPARATAITETARDHYAAAYASPEALTTGFDWYRAFSRDVETNLRDRTAVATPVLSLRGTSDPGDPDEYTRGLREAGIGTVADASIPNSGHFTPEENPAAVWMEIATFLARLPR